MSVKLAGNKLDGGTIQSVGFPDYANRKEWSDSTITEVVSGVRYLKKRCVVIFSSLPINYREGHFD